MEDNKLEIFKSEEFGEIRSITIKNEPYFVGKDIAEILKYTNPQKALRDHVDAEDKTVNDSFTVNGTRGILINESGLYSLIMSSKLPIARKFKRWITNEVLPSIRKNGGYIQGQEELSDDELISKALLVANRKIEEKNKILIEKEAEIKQLKPKAKYCDLILQSPSTITVTSIAKDYGMSGIAFNQLLHELGIQYKQSQQWFLFAKYQKQGYTHGKTTQFYRNNGTVDYKINTEWTQKGRLFLYNKLKENGYIPLIEREVSNNE